MADPARVPVKLEASGDTHIGGRTHNEDAILLRPDLNLYIVADGAGGQNAGNVASTLATTSIARFFEQTKLAAQQRSEYDDLGLLTAARQLSAAVQEANREIIEIAKSSDRHRGMGTTVVAALFSVEHRHIHVAHVGDSRLYRLRDGRLELLTHDHSLANDVLELRPDIEDGRIKKLPKNVITRALGMSRKLRVSTRSHDLVHGDRYLLCTDGLSDVVAHEQISEALGLDATPEERVRLLVELALESGSADNVAVVLADCALAARATKTATRPARKLTPPSMPAFRMRPRQDTITDESVPEIVLFEDARDRDSSPMIHVVPIESATADVVEAVSGVMAAEGETVTAAIPRPSERPAPKSKTADVKLPDFKLPNIKMPVVTGGALGDAAGGEPPKKGSDRPVAAGSAKASERPSAPPSAKPSEMPSEASGEGPARTTAEYTPFEVGGAALTKASASYSAPRRHKVEVEDEPTAVRTGNTAAPPGPTLSGEIKPRRARPPADSEPTSPIDTEPPPRPATNKSGPPPLPTTAKRQKGASGAKNKAAPKASERPPLEQPKARDLLDTNDFVGEDTVSCHACGSVISRKAEYCLYCGAATGFVVGSDAKKP
jgi:protein phosphatase